MTLTPLLAARLAAEAGFDRVAFERLDRLQLLAATLAEASVTADLLAVKGGTALRAFHGAFPRLSLDIDTNYVGASSDDEARGATKRAVEGAARACGLLRSGAWDDTPALSALSLWFKDSCGSRQYLSVEISWTQRVPLWDPSLVRLPVLPSREPGRILALTIEETIAGKLCALIGRARRPAHLRDLFDAAQIRRLQFDRQRARLAFAVTAACQRFDVRETRLPITPPPPEEFDQHLRPLLRGSVVTGDPRAFCDALARDATELLAEFVPLPGRALAFVAAVNDHGVLDPGLLTDDPGLVDRIARHPHLVYKAEQVRRFGTPPDLDPT